MSRRRGKGKKANGKKRTRTTKIAESMIVVERKKWIDLQADLRGSRWLIAALVEQLGGSFIIDPKDVEGDKPWELIRRDDIDTGVIELELKGHVKKPSKPLPAAE